MNIENIAKKFLSEYLEKYEGSKEGLKGSIESLDAITITDYLNREGLGVKDYYDFKTTVLGMAEHYANIEEAEVVEEQPTVIGSTEETAEKIEVIPPTVVENLVPDDIAKKFMQEYKEHYSFDFNDSLEIDRFIESMALLDEEECIIFLEKENLNIDYFDAFQNRLIELAPEFAETSGKGNLSNVDNSSNNEDKAEEMAKIIYDRYMARIHSTDIADFEKLFINLDNADIRMDNEEEAQYLSNTQVKELIAKIKNAANNYAFDKILENKEIKSFVSDFLTKLSNAKSLEDIENLKNELNKIIDCEAMNKLNHFNKMLVFGKLSKVLDKKAANFEKDNEKITALKDVMPSMTIGNLFAYLNKFDKNDPLYDEVNDLIMEESVSRFMASVNISEVEDLDHLREHIKYSDVDAYAYPEIRDEFKTRVEFEIEKERARRSIYDIGTRVYLEETVLYYNDVNSFIINEESNKDESDEVKCDDIMPKNTKAIVDGYVLNSETPTIINDKDSAIELIASGYDMAGYELKQKEDKFYVAKDVVKKRKFNKKIAAGLLAIAAVGCAAIISIVNHFSNGKKDVTIPKDDTPTISTEVNNTDEIINIKDEKEIDDNQIDSNTDEEQTLEEEVEDIINNIPGMNASIEIDKDARIYSSKDSFDTKGNTSYFNTHNIDVERTVAGYVLEDQDGRIKVYTDMNKVYDLVMNKNYNYLGVRTLNNYSKSDTDYEGFYKASNINLEGDSLVRSLKR